MKLLGLACLVPLIGCVDLKPAPAPPVRWLSIGSAPRTRPGELAPPVVPELELASVRASEAVGDVHVRRLSAVEVQYDDLVRWVEQPEAMVERALEDELFRRRGFVRAPGRRLDVELVAFEESLVPRRRAVVVLEVLLTEGDVLLDRRIEASVAIADADPAVVARALSDATMSAVIELSDLLAVR